MDSEYGFLTEDSSSGYQEKESSDMVTGSWMCRGTQNMILAQDGTIQTRKGTVKYGTDSTTAPITWADTWTTNTSVERPLKSTYDRLITLYNGAWVTVWQGFGKKTLFQGKPWWDKKENKDKYTFVNGTNQINSWLGGLTESLAATAGATTLSKKFMTARTTVSNSLVFNAAANTITASWTDFVALGFTAGQSVTVGGGNSLNQGQYKLKTVATNTLTLTSDEIIANETVTTGMAMPTGTPTITPLGNAGTLNPSTTYYYVVTALDASGTETSAGPQGSGSTTSTLLSLGIQFTPVTGATAYRVYRSTTTGVFTNVPYIVRSGSGSGTQTILDSGGSDGTATPPATNNTGAFVAVYGRETWNAERFSNQSTQFTISGSNTVYTATGGVNDNTLTGITPALPAITAGTLIFSPIISAPPTGGDIPANVQWDTLNINNNQILLGCSLRRDTFGSKDSDYLNYGYTAGQRLPGDGYTVYLDNALVSIDVSDEGDIHITAGNSDVYKISLDKVSVQNNNAASITGENVTVKKIKTSVGQAANNKYATVKTKNDIAYYTKDPTVDSLGRVESIDVTQQSEPVSDPIRDLIGRLNANGVNGVFWKNNVVFMLPSENTLLIYDAIRKIWQPPQIVPGAFLSIIAGQLCVHSAVDSTTYQMFSGPNDDGKPISFNLVFNYKHDSVKVGHASVQRRWRTAIADKYYVELKLSGSATNIVAYVDFGYNGSVGTYTQQINATDGSPNIISPGGFSGIGANPIGQTPIGSYFSDPDTDPVFGPLFKGRYMIPLPTLGSEFFEQRFRMSCDTINAHFELISHGSNMRASDTVESNLIKQ